MRNRERVGQSQVAQLVLDDNSRQTNFSEIFFFAKLCLLHDVAYCEI